MIKNIQEGIRRSGFFGASRNFTKKLIYHSRLGAVRLRSKIDSLPDEMSHDRVIDFAWNVSHGLLRPFQVRSEYEDFIRRVFRDDNRPKNIMEIGSFNGGTLFVSCRLAAPGGVIVSLDLPGGEFGGGYPEWKTPLYKSFPQSTQELHLIRGDSHSFDSLAKVKEALDGRQLDFLFIDGDHTYEGVKQDYEMYSTLVRPGGWIGFHDVAKHRANSGCEVDRLWQELKQDFECVDFINDVQQGWAGLGLMRNSSKEAATTTA